MAAANNMLLEPMRERRAALGEDDGRILEILRAGCERANAVAEKTLESARKAAGLHFFPRQLGYR